MKSANNKLLKENELLKREKIFLSQQANTQHLMVVHRGLTPTPIAIDQRHKDNSRFHKYQEQKSEW